MPGNGSSNEWSPKVENRALDDDLVMTLVEGALSRPESERKAYLESACTGDPDLLTQVWNYVEWEQRMGGFLLDPIIRATGEPEHPFETGQLVEGRFRIVREVARGGMGIVFEAMDEKLNQRIAIKCAKA